jgi:hypothetical protein
MGRGTEDKLGALHGAVATVLTAQISHQEEEKTFDADGEEVGTGVYGYTVAPATIAAAIKFLKDNQITCDIETDENMTNLRESLAKKQKRSRLTSAGAAALKAV